MPSKLDIKFGVSFHFFYIGLIAILASLLVMIYTDFKTAALLGVIIGIFLFLSPSGTLFDLKNQRYKQYLNILFIKIGTWKDLKAFTKLELLVNYETEVKNYRSVNTRVNVDAYLIALSNKDKDKIELKEFTNYQKASIYLKELGTKLNIETVDRQNSKQKKRK